MLELRLYDAGGALLATHATHATGDAAGSGSTVGVVDGPGADVRAASPSSDLELTDLRLSYCELIEGRVHVRGLEQ